MEMYVRGNGSIGRVARVIGKRLAPLTFAALVFGIGIPQFVPVEETSAAPPWEGSAIGPEYVIGPEFQQASSDVEPNSDATTIVLEDAVNSDLPPGPGIIAIL